LKLSDRISGWLKKEVKKAGAKGVVLGLSGGIDSAVVAAIAKQACGKNVLCLIMPCENAKEDEKDAMFVAKQFGLKTRRIDLSKIYRRLLSVLPRGGRSARANLKPRLRMAVLYYNANLLNCLVVGTGNRSEITTGYFTKYGDGGVDLIPLGAMLKKDVIKLAVELGVPSRIINKTPAAGLWEGQTDEDEMGITYRELDAILAEAGPRFRPGIDRNNFIKVKNMVEASAHKRRLPPVFS